MKGKGDLNRLSETSLLLVNRVPNNSANRRTRSPPFAKLETLSSFSVGVILMLPFLLASMTIFIDLNKEIHKEHVKFSAYNCPRPLYCDVSNSQLHVLVNTEATNLHYVTLKAEMHHFSTGDMPKYGINVVVVGDDETGSYSQTFLEVINSHVNIYGEYVQLGGFSTDRPWLLRDTKYLRAVITITDNSVPSLELLERMIFKIDFQSIWFTSARAILQIIFSITSTYTLMAWSRRVAIHQIRLREAARSRFSLDPSLDVTAPPSHFFLSYLVPEQIYTILMLVFLIMWQDLPGATFALVQLLSFDLSPNQLFFASLVKQCGQQGLFLCILLLSRSLGSPSTDTIGPSRRQIISATSRERESSSSSEEKDGGTGVAGGGSAWWEEPYSSGSSRKSDAGKGVGTGGAVTVDKRKKRQSLGAQDWMSIDGEDNEGGDRRSSRVSAESDRRVSGGGWRGSGEPIFNKRMSVGESGYGTNGKQSMKTILEVEPVVKHYALCRSHGDLSTEPFPLVESHPCSPLFFHFIIGWFLLFVLCLLEVTVQNLFTFPEVLESLLGVHIGLSLEQGLYSFFSLFMVPIRLSWVVLIWKALAESALKLKVARYMNSRYQQVAYRLFINQIMVGLGLLCATYVFQIYHFIVVMQKRFVRLSTFSEVWASSIVIADNGFGGWGGRDAEIGELIYVSCICYVISFLFVSPNMASYHDIYDHSEKGLAGTAHEYLVLEPIDQRLEEEHNISFERYRRQHAAEVMAANSASSHDIDEGEGDDPPSPTKLAAAPQRVRSRSSKPFCLETACILMECSWQTYFLPLDEPRSEEEAAARKASNDIFAAALDSTIPCKMNVAQYGLTFVRSFLSPGGDISGYLVKSDHRIIVAFRGTVGGSNVVTDINMIQTRLPDLTLAESHLRELFQQVVKEHRMESTRKDPLNDVNQTDIEKQESSLRSPLSSKLARDAASDGNRSEARATDNGTVKSDDSKYCDYRSIDMLSDDSSVHSNSEGPINYDKGPDSNNSFFDCFKSAIAMVPLARQALPLVHYGFWTAYKSIRDEYLKTVMLGMLCYYQEKKDNMYSNFKSSTSNSFRHSTDGPFQSLDGLSSEFRYPLEVYVCGHSLGGALAVLAALDLQRNAKHIFRIVFNSLFADQPVPISATPSMSITLYTFGSPRIGNTLFAKMVESTIKNTFRVEVDGDMVCRIPRLLGMYRHCGVHIIVDAEETGNIIVNPTVVESQLLRRGSGTTDNHSLSKYRVCLEACFLPHELESYLRRCFLRSEELTKTSRTTQCCTNPFDEDYYRKIMPEWV